MNNVNKNLLIGSTVLGGYLFALVTICKKIDRVYTRIADRKGWYYYDNKKHKRIYL